MSNQKIRGFCSDNCSKKIKLNIQKNGDALVSKFENRPLAPSKRPSHPLRFRKQIHLLHRLQGGAWNDPYRVDEEEFVGND